jgi:hypothetical protein
MTWHTWCRSIKDGIARGEVDDMLLKGRSDPELVYG